MAHIRQDMETRHAEFWEMRNLVQSLPDHGGSPKGSAADDAVEDDQRACPLADELIDTLRLAHRAYFAGDDSAKYDSRYGEATEGTLAKIPVKIEDVLASKGLKFWPQKAGINTVDPTFGWNIAMHCAALGKKRTLKRLIKFRYQRDTNGGDDDDTASDQIEASVALNLGHRSSHQLDLRAEASIRVDPEKGVIQEGGYRVSDRFLDEHAWRQFFDTAKKAGYPDDLLDEHRFGYWSMRSKSDGSPYQAVVYPRLSSVLTICHMVGERSMKTAVQAAMKKSTEARRRGDQLAALSDFHNDMDYTDEASSKYKEAMAKENMFADAAVKMIESHLQFIPYRETYLSKSTPIEYTNRQDPAEDEWTSTTLEDVASGKVKEIDANTYIRVAPGEEWTVGTVFAVQQGKEKQYSELQNDLVAGLQIDELLTKHYKQALKAFEAWESMDPDLLSVGVEDLGPLFMTVVKHAVRNDARKGHIRDELKIAERLLEKLGPIQAPTGIHEHRFDLIDFTLQDENGRTLKWLCRHLSTDVNGQPRQPFCDLPNGVDSSVPFYLYRVDSLTVPDTIETVVHSVWPLYLIASHVTYYLDLFLDYTVTRQYWRAGGCKWRFPWQVDDDRQNYCGKDTYDWWEAECVPGADLLISGDHPTCEVDPDKSVYVVYSVLFCFVGIIVTCCFDVITTMTTSGDRKSKEKWIDLGWKCLLNALYLRLPYEAWGRAYRAWSTTVYDLYGKPIEKTPRMPPMSWDQVKCSEGIFEALPQSMLQAFVVINDLYRGRSVTVVQTLSLFTSYANIAFVLGMMGPPDIRMEWRATFMVFVGVNVVLRSAAFSFLTILDADMYLAEVRLDPQYDGWWGRVATWYLLVSFIVTLIFTFGLQKKELSLSSIILSLIAFMCPVDISQFTVLKTAQPRSPQVPFAIVRFLEITVICVMFAQIQDAIPVIPSEVQTLDASVSSGPVSSGLSTVTRFLAPALNSTDQLIGYRGAQETILPWETCYLSGTEVVPPEDDPIADDAELEESLEGESFDDDRTRWLLFPSLPSKGRWPKELVRIERVFPFNIGAVLTAVIFMNIFTYFLTVVFPRRLLDPMPAQLKILAKGSEIRSLTYCCRRKEVGDFKQFVKNVGGEGGEIAMTLIKEPFVIDEAQIEKARLYKRAKQEERRLQKQGKDAIELLDRILRDSARAKLDVRNTLRADILWKLNHYSTVYGLDTASWFPEPEPEPEAGLDLVLAESENSDLDTHVTATGVPHSPVVTMIQQARANGTSFADTATMLMKYRSTDGENSADPAKTQHLNRAATLLAVRSISALRVAAREGTGDGSDNANADQARVADPKESQATSTTHEEFQPRGWQKLQQVVLSPDPTHRTLAETGSSAAASTAGVTSQQAVSDTHMTKDAAQVRVADSKGSQATSTTHEEFQPRGASAPPSLPSSDKLFTRWQRLQQVVLSPDPSTHRTLAEAGSSVAASTAGMTSQQAVSDTHMAKAPASDTASKLAAIRARTAARAATSPDPSTHRTLAEAGSSVAVSTAGMTSQQAVSDTHTAKAPASDTASKLAAIRARTAARAATMQAAQETGDGAMAPMTLKTAPK